MARVAAIGLGSMGAELAKRLATRAGALHVFDASAARTAEIAALGAMTAAPSAVDAARGADVVFSCLPTSAIVHTVIGEAAPTLKPGTVWVEVSPANYITLHYIS